MFERRLALLVLGMVALCLALAVMVHSLVLCLGFSIALRVMWPGLQGRYRRRGFMAMAISPALLALIFLNCFVVFALLVATGAALPTGWLMIVSIAHLFFEFLLGSAAAWSLERLNDELMQRNRDQAMAASNFGTWSKRSA